MRGRRGQNKQYHKRIQQPNNTAIKTTIKQHKITMVVITLITNTPNNKTNNEIASRGEAAEGGAPRASVSRATGVGASPSRSPRQLVLQRPLSIPWSRLTTSKPITTNKTHNNNNHNNKYSIDNTADI